jgi:hypothetical protein
LLPPYDMYLYQRDRMTLIGDRSLHRLVWRSSGNPGVALVDGQVSGLWRPRKQGKKLLITIAPFVSLDSSARAGIEAEATAIAALRACTTSEVTFNTRA